MKQKERGPWQGFKAKREAAKDGGAADGSLPRGAAAAGTVRRQWVLEVGEQ